MIAADTNIVVRLVLGDDAAQIGAIMALLERQKLFVSLTVLLEAGWVLESRYRMPRADVAAALEAVVALEGIQVARAVLASWAIDRYRAGADFGDMIHLVSAAKVGAFATLDRRLARAAGAETPVAIETLG